MRARPLISLHLLGFALLVGCLPEGGGDDDLTADACAPRPCACEDGRPGMQFCSGGPCTCAPADAFVGALDGGRPDAATSPRDAEPTDGAPATDARPPTDAAPAPPCDDGTRQRRPCGLNARGVQWRACAEGAWTPWDACADPDACADDATDDQTCGEGGAGTRTRTCFEGQWSSFGPCEDPSATCEDGVEEIARCGLNGRGEQSRRCVGERWAPFEACVDPDVCVDDATGAQRCGLNGRGGRVRTCVEGQWGPLGDCEDPDACVDEALETRACGLNGRGQDRRACAEGAWAAWSGCADPDACVDGAEATDAVPCGVDGNGTRARRCGEGQWGAWGACDDPDRVCADGESEAVPCGLNGRGEQRHACVDGRWGPFDACADPDVCVDAREQRRACGLNDNGEQTRACAGGQWQAWSDCVDGDACVDGADESRACGHNMRGTTQRTCDGGRWSAWAPCDDPDECAVGSTAVRDCDEGGRQLQPCEDGQWGEWTPCALPPCPAGDARCAACRDAFEPNTASLLSAADVPLGVTEDLTLCTDLDRTDWYGVVVDSPSVITVAATWEGDSDLSVFGGQTDESSDGYGFLPQPGRTAATRFVAPAGVRTFLRVLVRQLAPPVTIDYRLEVTAEPFPACPPGGGVDCVPCGDPVPNDSLEAARAVALDTVIDDAVCGSGYQDPVDAWRLELPGPGTLISRLETGPAYASTLVLALRNAQQDIVPSARDGDVRRTPIDRAQTFYAVVESQTGAGAYRLSFDFEPSACTNGEDDDGDGRVDHDDPGCARGADEDETDPDVAPACSDAIDNDADGAIDYPADRQCAFAGTPSEEPSCLDGAPIPVLLGPDDAQVIVIDAPDRQSAYRATCGNRARGPEQPLRLDVTAPLHLVAEVRNGAFDAVLHLRRACDDPATELACDDDGGVVDARLEADLAVGPYFLFVDAYSARAEGDTTVHLTTTPR